MRGRLGTRSSQHLENLRGTDCSCPSTREYYGRDAASPGCDNEASTNGGARWPSCRGVPWTASSPASSLCQLSGKSGFRPGALALPEVAPATLSVVPASLAKTRQSGQKALSPVDIRGVRLQPESYCALVSFVVLRATYHGSSPVHEEVQANRRHGNLFWLTEVC